MTTEYEFTCPDCGEHKLEEIMSDVTVASEINHIYDGDMEYGEQTNSGGVVERYQCTNCGTIIAHSQEELMEVAELNNNILVEKSSTVVTVTDDDSTVVTTVDE